ncbi:MAG TPA: hypothetical protein PLK94_01265 [Alphaproteobacteria bacterium]|nr:hypothetical protein [Alphaproteobacteria bacterium]
MFFIENIGVPESTITISRIKSDTREYVLCFPNDREISIRKTISAKPWEVVVTVNDEIEDSPAFFTADELYQLLPSKIKEVASR